MNSAFSWDTFLDTQVAFSGFPHIPGTCTAFLHVVGLCYVGYLVIKLCVYILQMLLKFRIFLRHLPRHGFFFGFWYILKMLQKFHIFPGHLPRHRVFFFRVFCTLHRADAPDLLGTFTQTQGVFFFGYSAHYIIQLLQLFLGHLHEPGSFFFWVFRTLHLPDAPVSLGTFTRTWWFFFSGLSAQYIMQMLQFCLGHLPLNGVWVNVGENMLFSFRIFTHQCIMQMLWKFSIVPGHLYGHQGCFCQMFRTSP